MERGSRRPRRGRATQHRLRRPRPLRPGHRRRCSSRQRGRGRSPRRERAGNRRADRARSRLCRPGRRAGSTARPHARARLDRRRRVRWGWRSTLRRPVATCGRRAGSRRSRRPRRRTPASGDRRRHARLSRAHAGSDSCRTVHGGGRCRALPAITAGAARGSRRAIRTGRAGPLPRRRTVGAHRDHGG